LYAISPLQMENTKCLHFGGTLVKDHIECIWSFFFGEVTVINLIYCLYNQVKTLSNFKERNTSRFLISWFFRKLMICQNVVIDTEVTLVDIFAISWQFVCIFGQWAFWLQTDSWNGLWNMGHDFCMFSMQYNIYMALIACWMEVDQWLSLSPAGVLWSGCLSKLGHPWIVVESCSALWSEVYKGKLACRATSVHLSLL